MPHKCPSSDCGLLSTANALYQHCASRLPATVWSTDMKKEAQEWLLRSYIISIIAKLKFGADIPPSEVVSCVHHTDTNSPFLAGITPLIPERKGVFQPGKVWAFYCIDLNDGEGGGLHARATMCCSSSGLRCSPSILKLELPSSTRLDATIEVTTQWEFVQELSQFRLYAPGCGVPDILPASIAATAIPGTQRTRVPLPLFAFSSTGILAKTVQFDLALTEEWCQANVVLASSIDEWPPATSLQLSIELGDKLYNCIVSCSTQHMVSSPGNRSNSTVHSGGVLRQHSKLATQYRPTLLHRGHVANGQPGVPQSAWMQTGRLVQRDGRSGDVYATDRWFGTGLR